MSGPLRLLGIDGNLSGSALLQGLSTVAHVKDQATDLLHSTQRETQQIHQLQQALDALQEALTSGKHEAIQEAARLAQTQLHTILADEAHYKVNFRNYSYVNRWATYFTPLTNLKREIDAYLGHHFGHTTEDMTQLIVPAKALVDAEVQKQTGYISQALKSALTTAASRVQDGVSSYFSKGKQERHIAEQAQKLPPLLKLQKQIAYYNSYPGETIPEVVDENLRIALHELDRSSTFFNGIESTVLHKKKTLTPNEILPLINMFLKARANAINNGQLYQLIYFAAHERNLVPTRCITTEKTNQEQWAKDFLQNFETGDILKNAEVLWIAMVQFDELIKLIEVINHLETTPNDSLLTLSEKVDQALAFFEDNPYSSTEMMAKLSHIVKTWLGEIFNLSKPYLEKKDRTHLGELLTQAQRLINQGKYIDALKILKQGFETDMLTNPLKQCTPYSTPQSAIAQLVESYETTSSQIEKSNAPQENWEQKLNLERKNLVENLAYFSTFQVMEKVCGNRSPEESAQAFAAIHDGIKDLQGKAKEERFKQLIKAEIDKNPNKGFFGKIYAKWVVSFVFHIVHYFAKHFTLSLTKHLSSIIHRPYEDPLGTDHLSPIRRMNNAFVAYLQAEERSRSDSQGQEAGGVGRTLRMKHFLEQSDLNGGFEVRALVNEVVKKVINEFLQLRKPSIASRWNKRLIVWQNESQSIFGIIVKNPVAYILRALLLPFRLILLIINGIYFKGVKWGISHILTKLDIVNSVLDSANKALYEKSQFTSSFDGALLESLKACEKLLDQEAEGELKIHEGDSGKRLFEELVNNLFAVLDKRGQLTAEQKVRRDNLLTQSKEAIEDMVDGKIKQTLRDLLIFIYESMRTEEQMNRILISVLQNVNNALLPGKHPIHSFYSDKKKAKIALMLGGRDEEPSTLDLLIHFALESGKVSRAEIEQAKSVLTQRLDHDPLQGDLIIYYREEHPDIVQRITQVDLDTALRKKYQKAEGQIHSILDRILKKAIEDGAVSEAKTFLSTPENALIDYLTWLEQQFIPQSAAAAAQTFNSSYIETMHQRIEACKEPQDQKQAFQDLQKLHLHMMHQMQKNLKILASKELSGNGVDNKIRSIYKLSQQQLFPLLRAINEKILAFQATQSVEHLTDLKQLLQTLEETMQKQKIAIHAMKASLQHEDGSIGETVRKWKDWAIQGASKPCIQYASDYVRGRLTQRVQEGVYMYKDPNIPPLLMRHVVGLSYLHTPFMQPRVDAARSIGLHV